MGTLRAEDTRSVANVQQVCTFPGTPAARRDVERCQEMSQEMSVGHPLARIVRESIGTNRSVSIIACRDRRRVHDGLVADIVS